MAKNKKKVKKQASMRDMVEAMRALDLESIPSEKRPVAVMWQYLKIVTRDMPPQERSDVFKGFLQRVKDTGGTGNYLDIARHVPGDVQSETEAAFLDRLCRKLD